MCSHLIEMGQADVTCLQRSMTVALDVHKRWPSIGGHDDSSSHRRSRYPQELCVHRSQPIHAANEVGVYSNCSCAGAPSYTAHALDRVAVSISLRYRWLTIPPNRADLQLVNGGTVLKATVLRHLVVVEFNECVNR